MRSVSITCRMCENADPARVTHSLGLGGAQEVEFQQAFQIFLMTEVRASYMGKHCSKGWTHIHAKTRQSSVIDAVGKCFWVRAGFKWQLHHWQVEASCLLWLIYKKGQKMHERVHLEVITEEWKPWLIHSGTRNLYLEASWARLSQDERALGVLPSKTHGDGTCETWGAGHCTHRALSWDTGSQIFQSFWGSRFPCFHSRKYYSSCSIWTTVFLPILSCRWHHTMQQYGVNEKY